MELLTRYSPCRARTLPVGIVHQRRPNRSSRLSVNSKRKPPQKAIIDYYRKSGFEPLPLTRYSPCRTRTLPVGIVRQRRPNLSSRLSVDSKIKAPQKAIIDYYRKSGFKLLLLTRYSPCRARTLPVGIVRQRRPNRSSRLAVGCKRKPPQKAVVFFWSY